MSPEFSIRIMIRIVIALLLVPFEAFCKIPEKIDCFQFVKHINEHARANWTAHTYGFKEIQLRDLAGKLTGTRFKPNPGQPFSTKNSAPTTSETNEDNSTLPVNFTWIKNEKAYGCPIDHIRDQANCGSCWAVAAVSAFGDRLCLKSKGKFKVLLSENYVVSCNKKNYGCEGGYMRRVYNFLQDVGTITGGDYESDEGCQPYAIRPCGYPHLLPCANYMAYTPKCRGRKCSNEWYKFKTEKNAYKIYSYRAMSMYWDRNDYEVRQEIYNNGPIETSFLVYPDFLFYKGGIYHHTVGWWPLGGHAVKVVGWGVENGIKYWQMANSWGDKWGEDGFFRIRRGINECWIETQMHAVTPSEANATSYT